MKPSGWRLRPLFLAATVAILFISFLVIERISRGYLRNALDGRIEPAAVARLLDGFSTSFAGVAAAAMLLAGIVVLVLAHALVRQLDGLRADAIARAQGDRHPMRRPAVTELQALASAIDQVSDELTSRTQSLTRERDDLARLVKAVSEGILHIDRGSRIITANPAARTLLRLPNGAEGQPVSALVRNAELRQFLERSATAAETASSEVAVHDRRMLVTARPIAPAEGDRSGGAVVAFTDLTELRRLEGVRRDFVANVSHEIRTPLTSIRGYVETLLTDELPPDMQRQFLDVIHKNADRLHGIVDDLLDLSRLESGGWRPELRRLHPLRIADDVWTGCQPRAAEKRIAFVREGEDLPILADPAGLRQVLSNLFDNALRYTPEGGRIIVRVIEPAPAAEGVVAIEVEDTGTGIPRDALQRIFERFYRVDPARSRAEGGTGLGLSIVKHLVESMGGDVTARSELGKGTTMRIQLPAA